MEADLRTWALDSHEKLVIIGIVLTVSKYQYNHRSSRIKPQIPNTKLMSVFFGLKILFSLICSVYQNPAVLRKWFLSFSDVWVCHPHFLFHSWHSMYFHSWNPKTCCKRLRLVDTGEFWLRTTFSGERNVKKRVRFKITQRVCFYCSSKGFWKQVDKVTFPCRENKSLAEWVCVHSLPWSQREGVHLISSD